MSRPQTPEERILKPAEAVIGRFVSGKKQGLEARMQLLEASAARVGGFDLREYFSILRVKSVQQASLECAAGELVGALSRSPIPAAVALAALARRPQTEVEQKQAGAWYTDWRLAQFLVSSLGSEHTSSKILDPACGSGTLLVSAVLKIAGEDRALRNHLIKECVFGSDLDPVAIRGARLSLAALSSDIGAIASLSSHLRVADALLGSFALWSEECSSRGGFDVVVGNPPWERLRITKHEHYMSAGSATHYGGELPENGETATALADAKQSLRNYVARLNQLYDLQGSSDPDLYRLFTELALRLLAPSGKLAWLLPGGIIRSQGTRQLRELLIERASRLSLTVLSNRGRFFAVDSRQKVVLVEAATGGSRDGTITLRHAEGELLAVKTESSLRMKRSDLRALRRDSSIPEVRTSSEWKLFQKLAASGARLSDWNPVFCREVDMTLDKRHFSSKSRNDHLPLIEGRMVHQYRHDAKRYVSGRGRAAVWDSVPIGMICALSPQFWYPRSQLGCEAAIRCEIDRVGFCDITGQTNERGMLAARIPAGTVCGNKVPTILFDAEGRRDDSTLDLFVAIANSFAFDWLLRRTITTTVNYFLLRDLPWPAIDSESLPARRIAELSRRLSAFKLGRKQALDNDAWHLATLRAEIDCLVAEAWGLSVADLKLIFDDFPLLDRAHPPIEDEERSTVTRDFVLATFAERREPSSRHGYEGRIKTARALGAIPFVPSHLASADGDGFLEASV